MNKRQPPDDAKSVKQKIRPFVDHLSEKVQARQTDVGGFFYNFATAINKMLEKIPDSAAWRAEILRSSTSPDEGDMICEGVEQLWSSAIGREHGRLVKWSRRRSDADLNRYGSSDVPALAITMSQGTEQCMNWKGLPLFKTAFDFAIYAMLLWELKPATVIEIGSGAGGSAVWMADLMVAYGSPARVLSFDLNVPTDCSHEHVSFLHGDANEMSSVLSEAEVADLPHPWLVVEDAHVNVRGVLEAFDSYLAKGDYVVVEDSWMNERDISEFLEGRLESYRVDTALTDFFGRNVTCAQDSIFVRVA